MPVAAQAQLTPTATDPVQRYLERRDAINRANSAHSTGPRTESGKQRSSLNALSHGLTARTAVLPTKDPEAYQRHILQFVDEYQPATPSVQVDQKIAFDLLDAHRLITNSKEPKHLAGFPEALVRPKCARPPTPNRQYRRVQRASQWLRFFKPTSRAPRTRTYSSEPQLLRRSLRFTIVRPAISG